MAIKVTVEVDGDDQPLVLAEMERRHGPTSMTDLDSELARLARWEIVKLANMAKIEEAATTLYRFPTVVVNGTLADSVGAETLQEYANRRQLVVVVDENGAYHCDKVFTPHGR